MIPYCESIFGGVIPRLGQRQPQDALIRQQDHAHDVARLRIQFDDSSLPQYAEGTPTTITWGWNGQPAGVFHGYVHHSVPLDSSSDTKTLDVFCIAASTALKERSSRVYEKVTTADVVRAVASRHRMASVVSPATSTRVWEYLPQLNRSDWELLVWLARQTGQSLTCDRTTIYLQPRALTPSAAVPFSLVRGTMVQRNAVYDFSQRDGLSPFTPHDILTANGIGDDGSLINLTAAADPSDPVSRTTVVNVARPVTSVLDAREQINAEYALHRFNIEAEAKVSGSPDVRPASTVQILNASTASNGYWWVHSADHRITTLDYRMDLGLARDSVPQPAPTPVPVSWSGKRQVSGGGAVTSTLQPIPTTVYALTDDTNALETLNVDPFLGLQSVNPAGLSPARAMALAQRPVPTRVRGAAAGAEAPAAALTRYDGWRAESSRLVTQRGS